MEPGWTLQTLVAELASRGGKPSLLSVSDKVVRRVSAGDLAAQATAFAHGLREWGVQTGETVGLIAPNGEDWVVARLALGCLGAVVLAMDDLSTAAELQQILEHSPCRHVLTSAEHVEALRGIDPGLELVVLGESPIPDTVMWRSLFRLETAPPPSIDPDAPAMLVHTSGTTGTPKAFTLSSANLWANVGALAAERLVGPQDHILLPLPLHHVYPFIVGILAPLACGAAVVFPESTGGPQILRALSAGEATAIVGVPRLYTALVDGLRQQIATRGRVAAAAFHGLLRLAIWSRRLADINPGLWLFAPVRSRLGSRLRLLVSGGARLEPEVLWPLVGLGFAVRSGYGLAETASVFTGNLLGRERLGSEGRAFQGGELRIASLDGQEEGEIQLRGPSVFGGYLNNDAANRDAFTRDGWFRTGDLGRLDADGFLYVTGRIKEAIVLGGGKKVHPDELEKLYGADPCIREIAVLERGGTLVALVLPDLEAIRAAGRASVKDVVRVALATVASGLPPFQRLAGYRLVREPLPRTRLGKYQRFRLPAIYVATEATPAQSTVSLLTAEDLALLESEAARSAYDLLKARYAGRMVSLDASPQLDLGIDSLEWVALNLALEQRLGVRLDQSAAESLTVRDFLHLIAGAPPLEEESGAGVAVRRWLNPAGPALHFMAKLLNHANALLTSSLFQLTVTGKENLPDRGPYVVVPNHASDLDPLLIAAALGAGRMRHIHFGGDAARLFGRRWLHPFWRALQVFPVDERNPGEALAIAAEFLRRGESLVWFPESWRSPDGRLQRFLPGIGRLLTETRAPVVPARIEGAFEAMPRSARLPRLRRVRITFGPPIGPDALLAQRGESAQPIADRLHDAVAALGEALEPLEREGEAACQKQAADAMGDRRLKGPQHGSEHRRLCCPHAMAAALRVGFKDPLPPVCNTAKQLITSRMPRRRFLRKALTTTSEPTISQGRLTLFSGRERNSATMMLCAQQSSGGSA